MSQIQFPYHKLRPDPLLPQQKSVLILKINKFT